MSNFDFRDYLLKGIEDVKKQVDRWMPDSEKWHERRPSQFAEQRSLSVCEPEEEGAMEWQYEGTVIFTSPVNIEGEAKELGTWGDVRGHLGVQMPLPKVQFSRGLEEVGSGLGGGLVGGLRSASKMNWPGDDEDSDLGDN
jgi:hypothetical protein